MTAKTYIFFIFSLYFLLFAYRLCFAKEVTILYTGDTHAMLYPCNCPAEADGGIARRATMVKQFKKDNPNILVLDSGSFFAGGAMDEYSQNTELDKERTLINLRAMELMQYDGVSIGDDEFNFGKDFLRQNLVNSKITFLSCNIESKEFSPYIIKEINDTKVGILGVSALSATQKETALKLIEPKIAVEKIVRELKNKGAHIIVVLSRLNEEDNLRLINEISGIDVLITRHHRHDKEPVNKIGPTLVLRPSWEGRSLGKLTLLLRDNKIIDYKSEELRLSEKINDDPDILDILPRCFSDNNCRKKGLIGQCLNPATLDSRCSFSEPQKIKLIIITSKECSVCYTDIMVKQLKGIFPGLVISYLYYPGKEADRLIRNLLIKSLPVYLLDKEIEKENVFTHLKQNLEIKGDFYMLKPEFSGVSYFLDRKIIKGKLDLFISLYHKDAVGLLDVIKEFNPDIHFLATEQKNSFDAEKGNPEIEEYLRSVCVKKYYPQIFWEYISCRAKNINSSWWEDCLNKFDVSRVNNCSRSQEGTSLLKENIELNKELGIMFGPTYLLENKEIFATQGLPSKEELRKIIKR